MEQQSLSAVERVKSGLVKGREALELLASTDRYVFHGSPVLVESLEPHQARAGDLETGRNLPDRDPAVFATDSPDIAIFVAFTSNYRTKFFLAGEEPDFRVWPDLIANTNDSEVAYVYVLNKESFRQEYEREFVSDGAATPVCVVEVRKQDLPGGIRALPELGELQN